LISSSQETQQSVTPKYPKLGSHGSARLPRQIAWAACLLFLTGLAIVCYRRPIPDDFDRYMYEAILLGKSQPIQSVYEKVKHESPRAEASSVLDSPQHLQELEPLYAIRPIYLGILSALSRLLPIQRAINLVSAASLLAIGVVVLVWTGKPLQTSLLMAVSPILNLGRMGTPDALAALFAIAAVWLIYVRRQNIGGLVLLFVSLGIRTDNILLLLAVLVWLFWQRRIPLYFSVVLALLAIGMVAAINHSAGNYGWIVLFRFSFVGGRYPAQIPHSLTLSEYSRAFFAGLVPALPQLSVWILIGLWAWLRRPNVLLAVIASAVVAHFLLFPSPEVRYLLWAGIIAAALLIGSFAEPDAEIADIERSRRSAIATPSA